MSPFDDIKTTMDQNVINQCNALRNTNRFSTEIIQRLMIYKTHLENTYPNDPDFVELVVSDAIEDIEEWYRNEVSRRVRPRLN